MSEWVIRTEKLTKFYGRDRGIENLDLAVPEGEIFGFIGPNGAGKTTTIRTLLNLIFPTSGKAEIFGLDVVSRTRDIKQRIGYVPSEVKYYPGMSVSELLRYSASFYGISDMTRAWGLAKRLGLERNRRIEDLSSGNAKKVALVQSMLHAPRLLILDEPTNGLDPLVQSRFSEILLEENARGVTVFFSSHVLSEVQRLCRRVAIVKDGGIITTEDVATLRQKRLRKVAFTTTRPLGPGDFASAHVLDFNREGESVSFLYAGESNSLVRELAGFDIHQLRIEEPTLEEVFMHYYRTDEAAERSTHKGEV
jgi:ABC-2 type transport system ATP-binding protein